MYWLIVSFRQVLVSIKKEEEIVEIFIQINKIIAKDIFMNKNYNDEKCVILTDDEIKDILQ